MLPVCLAVRRVQLGQVNESQALPSLRVGAVHRALVFLVQMVKADHLVELLSLLEALVLLCLAGRVKSGPWRRPQPDSPGQPATGCRLLARPHELAAECSWDFRF